MRRGPLLAVAALTLLGAAGRFATLGVQSYWYDEAVTVGLLRRSFGGMLGAIPHSESTPYLYDVLAWPWARLFGTSDVGLRSLSALIGTLTIPVAYAAVRRFGGPRAGVVAAALTACSPLLIWYSQEARAYGLLVLLCAVSLWCFAEVLDGGGRRWLAAWAVASAAALATHYFALFPLLAEAGWLAWRGRPRRGALWAVGAVAVVGAALLPLAIEQAGADRAGYISGAALSHRIVQAAKQFLVGYRAPGQVALTVVALAAAVLALALLARAASAEQRRGAAVVGIVAAFAAGLPVLLAVVGVDYILARNLLAAWLPCLALVAIGCAAAGAPRAGAVAAVVLCATGLTAFVLVETHPEDQRTDWKDAVAALGPVPAGGRAVVSDAKGAFVLKLYLPHARPLSAGGPVSVQEIDLVHTPSRIAGLPGTQPGGTPPPGFTVSAVRREPGDTVTVLRAARPRPLSPATLAALAADHRPAGVLVQGG